MDTAVLPKVYHHPTCKARIFSVSKNDTLQGEPISARSRGTEIPSPWWLQIGRAHV